MDEYYPIIAEGDWGPEHAKSVKNKLQIYFQSKKKSQGGDCVVQYNDGSNSATILFKSSDIQDSVLSKAEHIITIDNQKIKLKVYKPSDAEEQADSAGQQTEQACGYQEPHQSALQTDVDVKKPQESSAVVLEDLPDDVKQEVLTLLVEIISSLSENDFSMELIPELRKAVVTFKNPSAAEKFLEDSRTHEKFKKNNLRARALERSTCVRVEDLPAEATKMLLELYFEKWGGPVEEVITIPSEQAAIIIFKEEEAKERVFKQENNICDVPVKIYPYFKSLETVLYGGKRPHLKLAEPITLSVHPAIREFILKKGQISSMKDQMSSHFCQINMDKPEVLLSPDPALLKQKGVTRRHINGWSENTIDAFKKIISNYTISEWPVSQTLWSKVESDVKELVKDQVFIDLDAPKGVLTLAGMTYEIIGLKSIMEKILERATKQIEREKNSVTEYMEISPAMYSLLEQDGLKSAVSPDMHIDYNKNFNRLDLSGLHTEILIFKNWVLEKNINMKQKHLQFNCSILEFLRSMDCNEMSRDLFISHGITAVYTIENGDVVVIGSTERALAEAEKRVNTVLTTKDLTVEDHGVLQMPAWQDLKKQLHELFNTSKKTSVIIHLSKQRDKVMVTGFREPVMEVSENLGCFIEKHTRIEETVRVKSHAAVELIKVRKSQDWQHFIKSDEVKVRFDSKRPWIKLSGQRTFVQPAMTLFKRLADALYTDTLIIKKAGAKKYFMEQGKMMLLMLLKEKRFVVVLQEDDMLEEEEDAFTEGSFDDIGQVSCEVQMPGGVTVTVRKADICKINVDAVVNAANEDLKHIGGVALALLQAAGPSLQQTCDQHTKANGPLKPGEAIITDAGRLPCKYVVHAVGPRFTDSDRRTTVQCLKRAVRESLNQASSRNCSSIAIPVISSGVFGCPLDLCTESIAKEVCEYIKYHNHRGSNSTLTEIHLVDNNGSTVNDMTQAVRKEFAAYNPKMTFPHQAKHHGHGAYGQGYRLNGRGNYGQIDQGFEVVKGRGNRDFEDEAHWRRETSSYGGRPDISEGLSVLKTKTIQEGLKIILSKGNIQDASADVIVNTISEDLDLSKGAVSKALLQTAGHQLQSEITRAAHSNNVNYGEMVITDGYKLKCSKVFHVVCPFWHGGQNSADKVIIQIIRDCLRTAETQGMASISFPAIGTGNLGFPKDLVARIMLTEVQKFNFTNLQEVTVIVHPSDKESIECFTSIFRHGIQGPITKGAHRHLMPKMNLFAKSAQTSGVIGKVSSPSLGVHTMQLDQVTLEVSSGDLTKEKTDAIVNSSNQTFSLKAGVSKAILDAAGVQVEQECLQMVGSSTIQQTEIVTSSGQLPCGNIIHVIGRNSPSDIKDAVLSVLKLCESQKITSVAFPALGTGQGGANPADVADAMVDAVVDFVKKKKPVHVRLVKFLIFQTNMVADFHQRMIRRSGEKVEEDKGLLTKIKDFFWSGSSDSPANEEFVVVGEEIEPAVFQLCGETPEDLSEGKDMINSMILREHVTIPIHDPAITHFTKEDGEMLNAMQRELTVSVRLEKKRQDSVITLEGLTRDVHTAESRIRDMIRKVERNENRRREAFFISSVVQWQYQENGRSIKNFDILTNYDLEQAFQRKQPSVKIKINNVEYEADLVRKEATKGSLRIELNRVDLEVAAQRSLPSDWEDMKGQSVVLVKLTAGSKEYAEVEKEFTSTGLSSNSIITIERVQNSALWRNYMIKKEELEDKNKHTKNEKRLFHGTGPDKTDQINNHGFNRSFAGMHGAMYGNGSYFAVDPNYSAQGYSKPDVNGRKRMYLARVLVGDFTKGKGGLPVPPAKSSNSADLYNSVTDNMNKPTMFVIFNDVQAYPEYLITFQ
ncbi:poly [ADP-ribose] polymerase 14-like isoform X2 [Sinocyclocheilus grahami]|uniref:poly [ADP-ribose] polymerase 14-like isoform X1 n=2 Tax=Sinocyclocheilus grahami TaxID=75366 RepID=UPI0007AD3869|nr:PREDICTED: poly [ADP-ribose] polymerase 14-like isoform X1 [Sinocyclocheilus grahami]XP_016089356.1 PREDICTED: poly [ADP-ribose] polymerase 14-like isoform X2 [Sinocyclocheilus grahami]